MKRNIYYKSACNMEELADESINIVVTSPPYPMVEMWDDIKLKTIGSKIN